MAGAAGRFQPATLRGPHGRHAPRTGLSVAIGAMPAAR
jgi:hypothetical protein